MRTIPWLVFVFADFLVMCEVWGFWNRTPRGGRKTTNYENIGTNIVINIDESVPNLSFLIQYFIQCSKSLIVISKSLFFCSIFLIVISIFLIQCSKSLVVISKSLFFKCWKRLLVRVSACVKESKESKKNKTTTKARESVGVDEFLSFFYSFPICFDQQSMITHSQCRAEKRIYGAKYERFGTRCTVQ